MAQAGALGILVIMVVGSLLKRVTGEKALRTVLESRGWTDIRVHYRPGLMSKRARFLLSGRLPDGHSREGFAYVGGAGLPPPFNKTVRLWDPFARPIKPSQDAE